MNSAKLLRYSMQLSMLKQLRSLKLISEAEYQLVEKKLKKDYGVILLTSRNFTTKSSFS